MAKRRKLFILSQVIFAAIFMCMLGLSWYFYAVKQSMHKVLRSFNWGELLFSQFFWQLTYYVVVILALHLLCGYLLWWLYDRVTQAIPRLKANYFQLGLLWLLCGAEFIFLSNQFLFPQSIFAIVEFNIIGLWLAQGFMLGFAVTFIAGCLVVLADSVIQGAWRRFAALTVPLLLLTFTVSDFNLQPARATTGRLSEQPNVIIIGIDSLRVDHINAQLTPAISNFLEDSLWFQQAYTPLARTYVAWMSILTGRYPISHGARFNLIDEAELKPVPLLPQLLQQQGYETAYAMDERLFSNIGEREGFDQIIGPPDGAVDFMLVHYGDFPLTNLLSGTRVAKWLLPSLYANRGAYNIYDPEAHSARLAEYLTSRQISRPLFMVAHFCLPHWPYLWASSKTTEHHNGITNAYQQAVSRADQQVASFLSNLKRTGHLHNAIVILMSDHGESLPGEIEAYRDGNNVEVAVNRFGHGSSVLSQLQNQVLLSWRSFGYAPPVRRGASQQAANLLDIAPTLHAMLMPKQQIQFDGISLLPWLSQTDHPISSRDFYLESGFYLPVMEDLVRDVGATASIASQYYRINAAGKVRIKNEYLPQLLLDKQRAIVRTGTGKLLASIRQPDLAVALVGIDVNSKQYYTEEELATDPEYAALLANLCQFYSQDPGFLSDNICYRVRI